MASTSWTSIERACNGFTSIAGLPADLCTHGTPRSGFHLYFQSEPGLRCSTSRVALGVDVRAAGGYVIVAGPGYRVVDDALVEKWPAGLSALARGAPLREPPKTGGDGAPMSQGASPELPKPLYFKTRDLVPVRGTVTLADRRRVQGILRTVCATREHRNNILNWAGFALRELIPGVLTREAAEALLFEAATINGYIRKDGARAAIATIRSGLGDPNVPIGAPSPSLEDAQHGGEG